MGGIGKTHAGVYQSDALAELVAVCDIDRKRAEAAAAQLGVPAYYHIDDMLNSEQIDAVSVCTAGPENGGHHYEPAMQCLRAGKYVLCEKPISNEIEKAREMVAFAQEKNLYFGINLNHRFVLPAERARKLIEDGEMGDLLFVNMSLWINNPNESAEYFHLRALHPHSIDVMRYFCGPIRRVQAFFNKAPGRKIWSNASINMRFANGVIGHLTGSYDASGLHPIERCEVAGTKGRFVLDNVFEQLTFYPRHSNELMVIRNSILSGTGGFRDTFHNRIHRWLEQITQGVPPAEIDASGAQGLATQEVIEAAIKSHETGQVVEVDG
jgi:predicted dehydrogenase